jgi:preprotein translocase subunit SecF
MLNDIITFLKSLAFIDYVFFFTVVFLIILVVSLIYFIKINSNETDELTDNLVLNENKNKDVKDPELNEIATALKNIKPIDFTPYEKEEEEKAIISYDELLSNTGQYELNYLNEEKNGDVLVKTVDLNNLINVKKSEPIKMEVHLMSLRKEEEFLKTLKELSKSLN